MVYVDSERVLNTSYYKDVPLHQRFPIVREDYAGIALEAGARSYEERINYRRFPIINGKVIDPDTGVSVLNAFKYGTELQTAESIGAERFYRYQETGTVGTVSLSISPPKGNSPYKEGRVNVAYKIDDAYLDFFGIPTKLDRESLFQMAIRISEHTYDCEPFAFIDDLRAIAFNVCIPDTQRITHWNFLHDVLQLDSDAFLCIRDGKPQEMKLKALDDISPIAYGLALALENSISEYDDIRYGAVAEQQMRNAGWELSDAGCPGKFNSQLLGQDTIFGFKKDVFGNRRKTWEYHIGDCANPKCDRKQVKVGPCEICEVCEDSPEFN